MTTEKAQKKHERSVAFIPSHKGVASIGQKHPLSAAPKVGVYRGRHKPKGEALTTLIRESREWAALPPHIREAFEWTLDTHAAGYHYLADR